MSTPIFKKFEISPNCRDHHRSRFSVTVVCKSWQTFLFDNFSWRHTCVIHIEEFVNLRFCAHTDLFISFLSLTSFIGKLLRLNLEVLVLKLVISGLAIAENCHNWNEKCLANCILLTHLFIITFSYSLHRNKWIPRIENFTVTDITNEYLIWALMCLSVSRSNFFLHIYPCTARQQTTLA